MSRWLMEKMFPKNISGLCPCHLKLPPWNCKFGKGQNTENLKMALTCPFLMSLVSDFALLQWFTEMNKFCFLTKKYQGQTKPLVAILALWGKRIFRLLLAVAWQPKGCWTPKGYQNDRPPDSNLNYQTLILDTIYWKFWELCILKKDRQILLPCPPLPQPSLR